MEKLKYFFIKNKMKIIIALIIFICAIAISIGIFVQITDRDVINKEDEVQADYEDLKNNFDSIFTNSINIESSARQDINYEEIVYCKYNINEEKDNYKINAKIPYFNIDNINSEYINKNISELFSSKIIEIVNNSTLNTTFDLNYVVYVNNNIISLVINCKYKEGKNAQRQIIQTYNYDLEKNKVLNIDDILQYKNLSKEEVQTKISDEISKKVSETQAISQQGYNVYTRNENDDMYKVENTTNFFLGKNNYLYIVYAYGNNAFTSITDLVII